MKRTWLTWLAGLGLAWFGGRALADPPQELAAPVAVGDAKKVAPKSMPPADGKVVALDAAPVADHGMCANGGCDRRAGVFGDIGVALLRPYWSHNNAFVSTNNLVGQAQVSIQNDFNFDYELSPNLRFGWKSDGGSGVRIGYWTLQSSSQAAGLGDGLTAFVQSAAPLGATIGGDPIPELLATRGTLELQVWDLEFVQDVQHDCWSFLFTGGLRYAHINQSYAAATIGLGGEGLLAAVLSGHSFNGCGPTTSAEIARRFGNGGLSAYTNVRGSFLFGSGKQDVGTMAVGGLPGIARSRTDKFMPVGELEMGVAAKRNLSRSEAFLKIGVVSSVWHEAGNSSRSSNSDTLGLLRGGTVDDPNLGLFGVVVRFGFNF